MTSASSTASIRVMIADDEPDLLLLVRSMLALDPRIEIVAEASDGDEALDRWREVDADVLILDQRMPGRTGLEVAEAVLRERPGQLIVLFSAFLDDATRARASELGVTGMVSKDAASQLADEVARLAG